MHRNSSTFRGPPNTHKKGSRERPIFLSVSSRGFRSSSLFSLSLPRLCRLVLVLTFLPFFISLILHTFTHTIQVMYSPRKSRHRASICQHHLQEGGNRHGKRAGELSAAELESLMVIVSNPRQFRVPDWFLNRKKDVKDGKYSQLTSNQLDTKLRDDLERLKKMRNHRGLRHYWGIKVRGQHTKTTGRRGKLGK